MGDPSVEIARRVRREPFRHDALHHFHDEREYHHGRAGPGSGRSIWMLWSLGLRALFVAVCLLASSVARAQSCSLPARPPFAGHTFPLDSPVLTPALTPVDAFPGLPNFVQ